MRRRKGLNIIASTICCPKSAISAFTSIYNTTLTPDRDGIEELKKIDPLFEAIEKVGRQYTGVYKMQLLDLAEELGLSPLEVPRALFLRQCHNKITYEAETECFCIELLRISKNFSWLAELITEHMWHIEGNTLSKLSATYILCRQSSYPSVDYILAQQKRGKDSFINEQLAKSSSLIHQLNNVYFNSLEGKAVYKIE